MVTKPTDQLWADIDLRGGEAVWVLLAHLYALLVPVALCVAVYEHWGYLSGATDRPSLFFVAACLLTAGSAFEVAQNTMDRWYLTENTASATTTSMVAAVIAPRRSRSHGCRWRPRRRPGLERAAGQIAIPGRRGGRK